MIKLQRQPEPSVLTMNAATWLNALQSAIATHGSLKDIPDVEKQKLLEHYRHNDIKAALVTSSNGKCAFCECRPSEGGNVEVEHFKPKSIYPNLTFDWKNLLPSCRKCNETKGSHDTSTYPIVNPYDLDPEKLFYYEDISIKARDGVHLEIARRTIEVCGLETIRLWKPRADILISLRVFTKSLAAAIQEYSTADTSRKKTNRLRHLREALETIESLAQPFEKYSGYCKYYLDNCKEYAEAKAICKEEETV